MPCDSGVIHFQRRALTDHRFSPQRARELVKPEHEETAREAFADTDVNRT